MPFHSTDLPNLLYITINKVSFFLGGIGNETNLLLLLLIVFFQTEGQTSQRQNELTPSRKTRPH